MSTVRLTKAELRQQSTRLVELEKYLPTLQLKKALLQSEVLLTQKELDLQLGRIEACRSELEASQTLLGAQSDFDYASIRVERVITFQENIAGVECPRFSSVELAPYNTSLFETAPWTDALIKQIEQLLVAVASAQIITHKLSALSEELRQVTTRVNLFEKVLIPRTKATIKKIRVFLGDLQLGAISQAKVAKAKLLQKKEEEVSGCVSI